MCCDAGSGSSQAPAPQDNKFTDTLANIAQSTNDRAQQKFWPLEDQAIGDVQKFQTQDWKNQQIGAASADVASGFDKAQASQTAQQESMGINPGDAGWSANQRGLTIGRAGADAAARTGARERADTTAFNSLVGMAGKGDAKLGIATGAAQAGGNLYMQSQQNQMGWQEAQQQQANQGMAGLGSMFGMIGGGLMSNPAMFAGMSSKQVKTQKRQYSGGLKAVRKMPVQRWQYKPGVQGTQPTATPGDHVGPYAEDFKAATGLGDGRTINPVDALGVHQAAIKELGDKVDALEEAQA